MATTIHKKPTKARVLVRIAEYDNIGRKAFLSKYADNRQSRWRRIIFNGRLYDMKAVWGAAHEPPRLPKNFNTSEPWKELRGMGFEHVDDRNGISSGGRISIEHHNQNFAAAVAKSMAETSRERQNRLATAPKQPTQILVTARAFLRNPDVVAEVLQRSNGRCEMCKKTAPFLRSTDKTPYLEVHHKVQLAAGGEDTIDNAIALCPNCHREEHFG